MGATFIGTETVGGCVVGVSTAFSTVGQALTNLSAAVTALNVQLGVQNDAILTAKAAIRIPAVAIPQVQASASADVGLQLEGFVSDPTLYLQGLLDALPTVQASLEASIPALTLSETISANVDVGLDFNAQIAAIDAQLSALVGINLTIGAVITALVQAVAAVSAALSVVASMTASLNTVGAYCLIYTGPLSGLGAALDAVTPSTGVPGATNVITPVMFVPQSDVDAVNAVNNIYRTL